MNIQFPLKWPYLAQNTQNECMINLTQSLLLQLLKNASKTHQTENTEPKFMKSYGKFKNNMENLQ